MEKYQTNGFFNLSLEILEYQHVIRIQKQTLYLPNEKRERLEQFCSFLS
jgi:hypothetical protein